jgi:tetratricopeptide (TPR) repeat protein
MKKLLITIIFLSAGIIHAQTDEKETLRQLSQNALSSYQNQKFDDAIKFGQQAVDLSLKIYGTKNVETAVAYTNLGVIYREKKKFKESIENLQKAVDVYESVPDLKSIDQITAYETLSYAQVLGGRGTEAEANYLKAIEIAGEKFGKESREMFSPTFNLGNFYARSKKFDDADNFYLKSYALAIKNFGKEAMQLKEIEDTRICLIAEVFRPEREKVFYESKMKIFGEPVTKPQNSRIDGGVVNGMATFMEKPNYPLRAKVEGLSGSIAVRVIIDEQGNVTEAKAICGHPILRQISETAARKSKFAQTKLEGKPVSVAGIIVYNYLR